MTKNKILAVAPFPPPIHGSSVVSQQVRESRVINETIIICGIVRDCGRELSHNIPTLELIASFFADYRIVVFENNSKDSTKQILVDWAKSNPRIIISLNDFDEACYKSIETPTGFLPFFSKSRISRYVDYRNMLLDIVRSTGFASDYLMMVDMDVSKIDVNGFFSSFGSGVEWDAITAYGYSRDILLRERYHDTYALCKYGFQNVPQDADTISKNQREMAKNHSGRSFERVFSAYGGLAIFKMRAIQGLKYKVMENNYGGIQVRCEHYSLFFQMAQRGYDKIYINYAMRVKYQQINLKLFIKFFKNRFSLLSRKCWSTKGLISI